MGGISAPAAAAQIAIAGNGASSSASAQTPSRADGKISARGSRIRVWPRRSTSRPAIGAPTAVATKYAPETAPAAA